MELCKYCRHYDKNTGCRKQHLIKYLKEKNQKPDESENMYDKLDEQYNCPFFEGRSIEI